MRIAENPPPYCSVCFGSVPDRRFVDFEVAWDGPVLGATAEHHGQPIDDLIVCESCLKIAFQVLDLDQNSEAIERLETELVEARDSLRTEVKYRGTLEKAIGERPRKKAAA